MSETRHDDQLEHRGNPDPFNPYSIEELSADQERFYLASQWQLMWWKFRRHRLAVICGVVLLLLYGSILISEFLAPYSLHGRHPNHIYAPPQSVHLFHEGEFIGPFVYGYEFKLDIATFKRIYTPQPDRVHRIRYFCAGGRYRFWGFFKADLHLVCAAEGGTFFLLGTDRLGRDVLSRII